MQGGLGADKQAPDGSCAHTVGSGMTIDLRLVSKVRESRTIP